MDFKNYFQNSWITLKRNKGKGKDIWKKCKNQPLKDITCYHNVFKTKTKKILNQKKYKNTYTIWNCSCDCKVSNEEFIKKMYNIYLNF